jgi:hypothetical protein
MVKYFMVSFQTNRRRVNPVDLDRGMRSRELSPSDIIGIVPTPDGFQVLYHKEVK